MGCCLSTKNHKHPNTELQRQEQADAVGTTQMEEETVKEVLLETPVTLMIPKNNSKAEETSNRSSIVSPLENMRIKSQLQDCKIHRDMVRSTKHVNSPSYKPPQRLENEEDIIISEIHDRTRSDQASCNYSGTRIRSCYSNNTEIISKIDTGNYDKDEEEIDLRPPARKRRGPIGGRVAAPPSHGKQHPMMMPRNVNANENGGRVVRTHDHDDVNYEVSARSRLKPPVNTRVGDSLKAGLDADGKSDQGRATIKPLKESPSNDVVFWEEAESLENPVVSLECFIFL